MKTLVQSSHETVSAGSGRLETTPLKVAKYAQLIGALTVELVRHAPLTESEYQGLKNEHRERLGLPLHVYNELGDVDQPVVNSAP